MTPDESTATGTPPLRVDGLTKSFGAVRAVEDVSFTVRPGRVTGFLGPNGAGKSTTLRMLLGLISPDRGSAQVLGRDYRTLPAPARAVGAVLDLAGAHPGMTARDHLRTCAALSALPAGRVEAVLEETGSTEFADRRVGTFSTGMRQRLALATALLGEPELLILDEPSTGLDPAGIAWLRRFLRRTAAEGRTVLLSSHVLSEMQQAIDDVVLIDRGRVSWKGTLAALLETAPTLEDAFLQATGQEVAA